MVRRLWDAADRRDTETALSLYDPDVELDLTGLPVTAAEETIYRGHQGLRKLFAHWRQIWQGASSELVELIDGGERVVSVYAYRARGSASGIPVEERFASVWTISDHRVVRVQWFADRGEALAAAGLSD